MREKMERRIIHTSILDDDWILSLSDAEFRVFQVCLIKSNRIGIYPITTTFLSTYSNQPKEALKTILSKFSNDMKIHYIDNYIVIVNHYKYYDFDNARMAMSVAQELDQLPKNIISNKLIIPVLENLTIKLLQRIEITSASWLINGIDTVYKQYSNSIYTVCKPYANRTDTYTVTKKGTVTDTLKETLTLKGTGSVRSRKQTEKPTLDPSRGSSSLPAPPGYDPDFDAFEVISGEQVEAFEKEWGDGTAIPYANKVSDWAKTKKVAVTNPYGMMVRFAKQDRKEGKL